MGKWREEERGVKRDEMALGRRMEQRRVGKRMKEGRERNEE